MATRLYPCPQVRLGESSVPGDGRRGWLSSRVGQPWVEAADRRVWPVGRMGWGGGWLDSPVSPGQCPRPLSWSTGCEGACLRQQWGGHHQPARQHPAEHRAAQQAARQHPPGQRGAAQPRREGGECGPWPKPAAPGLMCTHKAEPRACPFSSRPSHFLFSYSQLHLQCAATPEKKRAPIPSKVSNFTLRSECAW